MAIRKAVDTAQLLVSEATLEELADVLGRAKFDSYVTVRDRLEFLRYLSRVVEVISVIHRIHACRDPRDDKFLELAVNGQASLIVTGDKDLLALNPFREKPIITAAAYLTRPM
jgi:putative PIN family toxin of toxin-antitoxin system